MKQLVASFVLLLSLAGTSGVVAQTTIDEARQQGKDMGKSMRADSSLGPTEDKVAQVPGYQGTDLPQSVYYDDPDRLVVDGTAQANTDPAYGSVIDRDHSRTTFSNAEILATTQRGTAIEGDPNTYLSGENLGGSSGACTPLPPSSGGKGFYEATCNRGSKVTSMPQSCKSSLDVRFDRVKSYIYYTSTQGPYVGRSGLTSAIVDGTCKSKGTFGYCAKLKPLLGLTPGHSCKDTSFSPEIFECTRELPGLTAATPVSWTGIVPATGKHWASMSETVSPPIITRSGTCSAEGNPECSEQGTEVCTSSDPETRIIDGIAVTQPCWAWSRQFTCQTVQPADDCESIDANKQCHYLRDECLDDPQTGACNVSQRIYSCPLPDDQPAAGKQYVCGGDVYCLNGNCETIEREASPDFKDAVVALHSIGDAGKQFDPNDLTVFSGERDTCHKKIFGAANCCSGKGVPLITPALCSAAEKKLDEKDDKGLCYKVGSYCSDKVLGVCVTSKDAYCCFGSKLARILQVQGRAQIGKPWDKPKNEQCKGFTIEEFQRLDLSKMDFTEVYAEFTEAAKLPDEVGTLNDIQQKIQGYYDLHGGK